jgi:hypothetical protein
MTKKLSSMSLEELYELAKRIKYIPPEGEYEKWSEQEIFNASTYLTLQNQIQMDASILACKILGTPMKILVRKQIISYVDTFGSSRV